MHYKLIEAIMNSVSDGLRKILNRFNDQINSHTIVLEQGRRFNPFHSLSRYRETNRAIGELAKCYPKQKYHRKHNIIIAFFELYSRLREANRLKDEAMVHRLTTTDLYRMWVLEPTSTFNLFKDSNGINLLEAKIISNDNGRWFQCSVMAQHEGDTMKTHVMERKLDQMESHARTWYFCKFQN